MTLQEKQQIQQQVKKSKQIQNIKIPASSLSSIGSYSFNGLPDYHITNADISNEEEENYNFSIEL